MARGTDEFRRSESSNVADGLTEERTPPRPGPHRLAILPTTAHYMITASPALVDAADRFLSE